MRLVGYLRVSTDRQVDEGLGLDIQRHAIRAWCEKHGHRLVGSATDEGISGSNGLDTRLGLADALELLRSGKAEGIVVYRLDRLARDVVLQEQLLADVWAMGASVFSTSEAEGQYLKPDPDDPSRQLIRTVLGAVNTYERQMISLRMKAGRARKAERGGYVGGGIPLGMRCRDGELVTDERERSALTRIAELHSRGFSTREIAAKLEAEGFQTKRGARWHSMTISRIVSRTR